MSARDTIERELFEICGAPEYGVDTETTTDRIIAALSAAGYEIRKVPQHAYDHDLDGKHICPTCCGPAYVSPALPPAKENETK